MGGKGGLGLERLLVGQKLLPQGGVSSSATPFLRHSRRQGGGVLSCPQREITLANVLFGRPTAGEGFGWWGHLPK